VTRTLAILALITLAAPALAAAPDAPRQGNPAVARGAPTLRLIKARGRGIYAVPIRSCVVGTDAYHEMDECRAARVANGDPA
jgi:hypothetical protein